MKDKNIDTVCVYQDYCIGCMNDPQFNEEDECSYVGWLFLPTYIFWKDKGYTYMTKKDNCFDYSTIKVKKDSFWNFYFTHQGTIKKEKIKGPEFVEIINGKKSVYFKTTDHSSHQHIKVNIHLKTAFEIDLDDFDFENELEPNNTKNINYEYNIHSYTRKFSIILSETVKEETKFQKLSKSRR